MVISAWKALLFVAGGTAAAGVTGYVTGAFDGALPGTPAPMISALPGNAALQAGGDAAAPAAGPVADPAKPEVPAEQAVEKQDIAAPRFDVVRVERDGSVVIAGRAAPNASVEVISGTTVIAETMATADGDFAVVLEDPLDPGEYQIVLRATTDGKVAATSVETALVSIPDSEDGQVLALVEEPGKPSRLITVPEGKPDAEVAPANGAPAETKSDTAPAGAATPPSDQKTGGATDVAAAAPGEGAAAETQTVAKAGDAPVENKAAAAPVGSDVASTAPGTSAQVAAAPAAVAEAPAAQAKPADGKAAQEFAVRVEAVEIEGRKVFVAGQASPGMTVRVYANDTLLGEARVSPDGRFLVETERDMAIGDYIVRADLLDDGGRTVVARAAVPFQREEGESIAAVAPPQHKAAQPAAEAAAHPDKTVASNNAAAETTAPRLEPVHGAVIIRRGDNLWTISRRVYGRGVRYSTIYVANQQQIADPHKIWPGQIFHLPKTTREGEDGDMKAMGDQMTTVKTPETALQ